MNIDLIGEILARVADRVPSLEPQEMARDWELEPTYVALVRQIRQVLSPVEPAAAFRQCLARELLPARRVAAQPEESQPPIRSLLAHKRLVLGAAAVGSVASVFSILGLVLLLVRRRLATHQGHSRLAL